jgi:hypothetical protein
VKNLLICMLLILVLTESYLLRMNYEASEMASFNFSRMNLEQFLDVVRLSADGYVTLEDLVRCNAIYSYVDLKSKNDTISKKLYFNDSSIIQTDFSLSTARAKKILGNGFQDDIDSCFPSYR